LYKKGNQVSIFKDFMFLRGEEVFNVSDGDKEYF
jgi:hypothetical protein